MNFEVTPSAPAQWLRIGWKAAALLSIAAGLVGLCPPAKAQTPDGPIFAITYLDVEVEAIEHGQQQLRVLREAARAEEGNLEFTVLQEISRPNRFAIVEGWKLQVSFDAHDRGLAKETFDRALKPIRNSPSDRHILQPFSNAPGFQVQPDAIYMIKHLDFLGGDPAIVAAAAPLVGELANASRTEPGAVRYEIYRQPPPRINHYQVISAWTDLKAFELHEISPGVSEFRSDTAQGGRAWRVNLYDQRLYKSL